MGKGFLFVFTLYFHSLIRAEYIFVFLIYKPSSQSHLTGNRHLNKTESYWIYSLAKVENLPVKIVTK